MKIEIESNHNVPGRTPCARFFLDFNDLFLLFYNINRTSQAGGGRMQRIGLLLVILLAVILAGCSSQQGSKGQITSQPVLRQETPEEVVQKFLDALKSGDTATAETCFREDYNASGPISGQRIELAWLCTDGLGLGDRRLYKYEIGNTGISGSTARVNVVSWRRIWFDRGGRAVERATWIAVLYKTSDGWRIAEDPASYRYTVYKEDEKTLYFGHY